MLSYKAKSIPQYYFTISEIAQSDESATEESALIYKAKNAPASINLHFKLNNKNSERAQSDESFSEKDAQAYESKNKSTTVNLISEHFGTIKDTTENTQSDESFAEKNAQFYESKNKSTTVNLISEHFGTINDTTENTQSDENTAEKDTFIYEATNIQASTNLINDIFYTNKDATENTQSHEIVVEKSIEISHEIKDEKNNSMPNIEYYMKKVIMVIGETGSGKSTFLNILSNAIENNPIENLKTFFKLFEDSSISNQVNTLYDDRIKEKCESDIVQTKSVSVINIKSSKNIEFILIDTPGIVCKRDGSIDMNFITCMEELFSIIQKVDCLILTEKSDKISCQKSTVNTISEFLLHFKNNITKVLPVFTFYPDSLVFNQKKFPFPEDMCYKKKIKCNNLTYDLSSDERKNIPKKTRRLYEKSQKKMMKIIDLIND